MISTKITFKYIEKVLFYDTLPSQNLKPWPS